MSQGTMRKSQFAINIHVSQGNGNSIEVDVNNELPPTKWKKAPSVSNITIIPNTNPNEYDIIKLDQLLGTDLNCTRVFSVIAFARNKHQQAYALISLLP